VNDLHLDRIGDDVSLSWSRPAPEPQHGEVATYRIYRSQNYVGGYVLQTESSDPGQSVSWVDDGAAASGAPVLSVYEIVPANAAGDGDALP